MLAFSRAITGLRIAEQNLYVTSNNLSNVETQGYHRQRLNQYSFQSTSAGPFQVGLGVDADTLAQIRSEYLETNYRNELASYGEYNYESKVYDGILSIVGSDGSAVQDCITDLWESFNELTKEYTTTVAGGYLRENAVSFISELNNIEDQLVKMQNELDTEVKNTVKKINDYATQIAQLNDQINRSESDGSLACELRDSRDSIIGSLSELVDITVEQATNTCVNVRTSNGYLVIRTDVNKLATSQIVPESTFCSPIWEKTGEEFEVTAGELKGILDMRGDVGNLKSSSNGAPKEQMDVVVSIDTDMNHKSIDDMFRNLTNMINVLDRQEANYQFYLTDGTKVTGKQLNDFLEHLYSNSIAKEIDNYNGTSVSGFMDQLKGTYGSDSESLSDMWAYVEIKGGSVDEIRAYVDGKEADTEKKAQMLKLIDGYVSGLDESEVPTLSGLNKYLNSKDSDNLLENYLTDYVDELFVGIDFPADDIKNYITNDLHVGSGVIGNMFTANSDNALEHIGRATSIESFRPDSNKYFMVFTDNPINNSVTKDDAAARMNEIDMRLIALTDEASRISWRGLAQKTNGRVIDINEFETLEGTENIALDIARDFNSRLINEDIGTGIPFFRAGLNTLLNTFAREINAIFRQGENTYGERHGEVVKDENGNTVYDKETGDPMYHNFDLFLKIDEKLPLEMGNVRINPAFSDVNKMPLSLTGETGDFQIGNMLVDLAYTDIYNSGDEYSTVDEFYANFILDFGQAANAATLGYENQNKILTVANEKIQTLSGVSMDEELSNMLKFQYSYTASSKMINVIDEMLETIISL